LEIDEALHREVKAMGSLTGRTMKDLVSEGLKHVLLKPAGRLADKDASSSALAELDRWFKATGEAMKSAPKDPTAREILEQDRRSCGD